MGQRALVGRRFHTSHHCTTMPLHAEPSDSILGVVQALCRLTGQAAMSGGQGWQADGGIAAHAADGFRHRAAGPLGGPFAGPLQRNGAGRPGNGALIGKDAASIARRSRGKFVQASTQCSPRSIDPAGLDAFGRLGATGRGRRARRPQRKRSLPKRKTGGAGLFQRARSDVQVVNLAHAQILSAFSTGEGKLAGLWAPNIYTAEERMNAAPLCSGSDAGAIVPSNIIARDEFLKQNPDMVARYLTVVLRGIAWTKQNRDSAVQSMARFYQAGAFGLSTGLEYFPGSVAAIEEVAGLCAVCARRGSLCATHVRNRDVHYDLGFTEAVATARQTGARLQISHIQPKFGAPPSAMAHTLELLDRARREGVDVAFDVIPHDWNHTSVVSSLPAWAREGGTPRALERLRDPAQRERMEHNPRPMWRLVAERRWDRIALLRSEANHSLVGLTFREIGLRRNADAMDAALDLLAEEGEGLGNLMWASSGFDDADIRLCLEQAECAVMSDTKALSPNSSLKDTIGSLSGYGWVARLLGHYARDQGVLTLPDAVRRITSLPAERLGLTGRGRLRPSAVADVAVFDPAAVRDVSDLRAPTRHPEGFRHVLLGGAFTLRDGRRTGANPGRVLRRAA